jgi:hypothetical protein
VVRDDRFNPDKAVNAAAKYLARMEQSYGPDWAIFAYHCGEGCVKQVMAAARDARGLGDRPSFAAAFFGSTPAHNRELYQLVRRHMDRDFSPTYWFRVRRAQQLLAIHREDPAAFRKLYDEYRNRVQPSERAPHRLSVWLKPEDFEYESCEDLKRNLGTKLVRALDNPEFFGFALRKSGPGSLGERDPENREFYYLASPSALGTLTYLAWETRRLHKAMDRNGEKFVPLEVTALVHPRAYEERMYGSSGPANGKAAFASHCSGQVFDISTGDLPPGQREALHFVLSDLGWHGYLGFVEEHTRGETLHIGPSPSSRDFFSKVFEEALRTGREQIRSGL